MSVSTVKGTKRTAVRTHSTTYLKSSCLNSRSTKDSSSESTVPTVPLCSRLYLFSSCRVQTVATNAEQRERTYTSQCTPP